MKFKKNIVIIPLKSTFIILIMMIFSPSTLLADTIDRIEPPMWWTGFKNPKLQLMVHGENIADYVPEISYAGVKIEKIIHVKNRNYIFIDLNISPEVKAGKFEISFAAENGSKLRYDYELWERDENSAQRKSFNSQDAIYLITPDRFANGDVTNDTVKGMKDGLKRKDKNGRHGGDLKGIINHLDYISDMGFTQIWINPVLENNQPDTSYHGYATTDFYQVDRRFGSNEELKELSQKAKDNGVGLIMDMIANHAGSKHWWMADLPTENWLNFPDRFVNTNHERTVLIDPYASKIDKMIFSDGWFVKTMPDLNQRNPLLANYLIQNSIWWVEYAGLSGIRMDTYPYSDATFMADWSRSIMDEYPNFNIVGEEWSTNPIIVSHWQRGKENADGYVSFLPSLMDFPLQDALIQGLIGKEENGSGLINIYKMLANDRVYPDPNNLVIFADNHDMNRILTQLNGDENLFKMAMVFTLTMRGNPQIYYGTEILMTSPKKKEDGLIRRDFPGGWKGDKVNAFTGKGLKKKQKKAQIFLKKLLNWRKNTPVIHQGKLQHYIPEQGSYVYFRYDDENKIMVLFNKNKKKHTIYPDRFDEMLKGQRQGKNILTGQDINFSKGIEMAPRSVMIIEIKEEKS